MGLTDALVAFARARRTARELRYRRVPAFAVSDTGGTPTVYYLCPDYDTPSGGVRVAYRHVDALNAMSIPAAVVHQRRGFRCTWFANSTRVVASGDITLSPADVLVVPEWYGPTLSTVPAGPRVVVFNQRSYGTFDRVPAGQPLYRGAAALLAVSEDNADYLRYAFPDIPTHVVRNVVDGTLFRPASESPGRRIAYMPRRRGEELAEVLHLLAIRGVTRDWELTPIDGRSERETADLLRRSAVFLSFSEREGFGMPPAEAMAAGCYVVGFTGLAGRDFFDPAYCRPIPEGDVLAFARAVEEICGTDPEVLAKAGRLASQAILDRYSEAGLRDDLRAFYGPVLGVET
jgi:glycosyltransferase involved in cell wall biosynthesis